MALRGVLVGGVVVSIAVGAIAACGGDDESSGAPPVEDSGTSSADNFVPVTPSDSGGGTDSGPKLPSGTVDPTFGDGGLVTLGSNIPSSETPTAVLRQADGKLLVVGSQSETSGAFIVRVLSTGALDPTFGIGGKLIVDGGYAYSAALQADGKILVGRFSSILRLNADGSVDKTFGTDGAANIDDMTPNEVRPLPDGKILVAGVRPNVSIGFTLARLTSAGAKDTTFDTDGYAENTSFSGSRAHSIAVDANGRYVVSGEIFGQKPVPVARFLDTGALDDTFGTNGQVSVTMPSTAAHSAVAIQSDGKIVVAGKSGSSCATFRLSGTDGALDTGFGAADGGADGGAAGIVIGSTCGTNGPSNVALRADGKILVGKIDGWFQLLTDGSFDSGFGTAGIAPLNTGTPKLPLFGSMYAMLLQSDNTVIGVGGVNTGGGGGNSGSIWKGTATGAIDTAFGTNGQTSFPFYARVDEIRNIDVLANDSILAVGKALLGVGLVRFGKDGAFDTTFGANGWSYLASGEIGGMQRDATGRIFVAAESTIYARTPEGHSDLFGGDGGLQVRSPNPSEWFLSDGMGIDNMGRPIIAGRGGGTGASPLVVARMTTSGVQDTTFGTANGTPSLTAYQRADGYIGGMAVQPDGKTVVAGGTSEGKAFVFRLGTNGALDASFGGGYVEYASVPGASAMALQADGKIVVAAGTTVARIDANGTLDATFGQAGVSTAAESTNLNVNALRVRSDGKIFLAGFTNITQKSSMAFVRLSATGALEGDGAVNIPEDSRAYDLGFQSNGAVILGGWVHGAATARDYALARFVP